MRESCYWVSSIFRQSTYLGHIFSNRIILSIFGFISLAHLVDTPRGEFLLFFHIFDHAETCNFFLAMSSGNDGAHKKMKIEKFPPSKISRKTSLPFMLEDHFPMLLFLIIPSKRHCQLLTWLCIHHLSALLLLPTYLLLLFSHQTQAKGPCLWWRAYPTLPGRTLLRRFLIISTNFGPSTFLPMTWGILKIVTQLTSC